MRAWSPDLEPEIELKGRIVGNKVQGLGISNMKGGLASFMMAGKALKKSGVKLKGDVILAAVVGEISRTPIGPWQSQEYRGEGVGTRHLLTHGMHSDYAVCCDGSDMNIVWAQTGVVQAKITCFGKAEGGLGHQPLELSDGGEERDREDDQDHRRDRAMGRRVRAQVHLQCGDRARCCPRSISAPSKAARPTGRITFPACARSTSTSACRRRCGR